MKLENHPDQTLVTSYFDLINITRIEQVMVRNEETFTKFIAYSSDETPNKKKRLVTYSVHFLKLL